MPPAAPTTCPWHPDRSATRACTRCGRPACNDCLVPGAVGSLCRDCARQGGTPGYREVPARSRRTGRWVAGTPPRVTTAIVALNLAVFLYGVVVDGAFTSIGRTQVNFGLFGPAVADGEWWRLVTGGFLHAGLLHVVFNMLIIWQAGSILEPEAGHLRFALLYFASLLAGSAGALLLDPGALTVGASGAAFGLMGALAVALWLRGVNVMSTSIGPLILINLVLTFTISGISIGGHVGGLLGGAVAGWAVMAPRKPKAGHLDVVVPIAVMVASVVISMVAVR